MIQRLAFLFARRRRLGHVCGGAFACALISSLPAADVTIQVTAAAGLKFEPARFVVAPGDAVTLEFRNPDDMMHNLVITRPGTRVAVVEAALALGADGPARNFVPATDQVLWATPVVNPGGTARLTFTAPRDEGVFPYVCTFPGHGLVMFGAMYVAQNPSLPPPGQDPHLPVVAAASAGPQAPLTRAMVQRTFLPDCSPAAIAIGLPGGQAYCFDAAQCRMRYAWRGGFIDHSPQWLGKGDKFAAVSGRIYYRAPETARLRIGNRESPAQVKWLGHRVTEQGPELRYKIDGATVIERPRAAPGGAGLEISYEIPDAGGPVSFVADPEGGATVTANRGKWAGPRLTLTPAEARAFTLTLTERPGVEPAGYWSMNDAYFTARSDPPPGVSGRAFVPGGTGNRREVLDTGIAWSSLQHGGTLMGWVKLDPKAAGTESAENAPVFSTGDDALALRLATPVRDARWHHLAAVLHHGSAVLFIDGREHGRIETGAASPTATLQIGSAGEKKFFPGLLDEVRIYDRALSAGEIAAIHRREQPAATKERPAS